MLWLETCRKEQKGWDRFTSISCRCREDRDAAIEASVVVEVTGTEETQELEREGRENGCQVSIERVTLSVYFSRLVVWTCVKITEEKIRLSWRSSDDRSSSRANYRHLLSLLILLPLSEISFALTFFPYPLSLFLPLSLFYLLSTHFPFVAKTLSHISFFHSLLFLSFLGITHVLLNTSSGMRLDRMWNLKRERKKKERETEREELYSNVIGSTGNLLKRFYLFTFC